MQLYGKYYFSPSSRASRMACAVAMRICISLSLSSPTRASSWRDAVDFPPSASPKKDLIHRNMIAGHEFQKDLDARMLPFVFNIRKVARGNVHFVAYFLAAFISACPRCFYGLPESCKVIQRYWSFCHNNSPNYILLFLSLLGYAYTVPTISQNNSYYCRIKTY